MIYIGHNCLIVQFSMASSIGNIVSIGIIFIPSLVHNERLHWESIGTVWSMLALLLLLCSENNRTQARTHTDTHAWTGHIKHHNESDLVTTCLTQSPSTIAAFSYLARQHILLDSITISISIHRCSFTIAAPGRPLMNNVVLLLLTTMLMMVMTTMMLLISGER